MAQNLRRVAADAQPDVFLIDSQAYGTACPRIPCHSASWFKPGAQMRQPRTPAREGHDIDDSPAHWLLGVESEWAGVRLIDGVAEQVARLRQGPPAGLSEFDAACHSELQKLSRDVTTRLALFDALVPDSTQEAALQTDNSEKEFGTWGRDGAEPTSGWGTAADYAELYVDRRRSEAFHSKGEAATIAGLMAIEIAIATTWATHGGLLRDIHQFGSAPLTDFQLRNASDFDVTRPDQMLWQSDRLAKRPLTAVEGVRPLREGGGRPDKPRLRPAERLLLRHLRAQEPDGAVRPGRVRRPGPEQRHRSVRRPGRRGGSQWGAFTRKPFPDYLAFKTALRNGVYVAAGDLDRGGRAELIVGGGPGGEPRVTAFSGSGLLAGPQSPFANYSAGDPENRGVCA